jgi:hypothetical protein
MAIVTSFRFTPNSGAICVDQESWHIWRRKNWFTDHLYTLLDDHISNKFGVELVYGGVGHPPFHLETVEIARKLLSDYLSRPDIDPATVTVEALGNLVLQAFHAVRIRRVNDRLEYFFGFDRNDFNNESFTNSDGMFSIREKTVKQRALDIVQGKETTGYGPLTPPVEACLIGIDKQYGFSAFCLKEQDGVLGFQSCWFESLGQGRQGAAIRYAKLLNRKTLDNRREGDGIENGAFHLLDAISEAMDHYGQNGGFIRMMILDGNESDRVNRLRDIRDNAARLCIEIVKAVRHDLLHKESAVALIQKAIQPNPDIDAIETAFFTASDNPAILGKLLRRYKISEPDLPDNGPEKMLYKNEPLSASVSTKGRS